MSNNGMPGFMVCSQLRSSSLMTRLFFSGPAITLVIASSISSIRIFMPFLLAARSAASFSMFSISAGENPGVLLARTFGSTPSPAACFWNGSGRFLSSYDIRDPDDDLTVESARTQQCRVKYIRTVGRSQDDDSCVLCEAIHFDQQLVEGLFPFIVSAAKTCASLTTYRIDLIDPNSRYKEHSSLA